MQIGMSINPNYADARIMIEILDACNSSNGGAMIARNYQGEFLVAQTFFSGFSNEFALDINFVNILGLPVWRWLQ